MSNYSDVLILHPVDSSTIFLEPFKEAFKDNYFPFDSNVLNINEAKMKLGDLPSGSLLIYIGHGSTAGLYEPSDTGDYEKIFVDVNWGNIYLEDLDVILLSCRSNEYIKKISKTRNIIGFGNIISSVAELEFFNKYSEIKLHVEADAINLFNSIYIESIIKAIKLLLCRKIVFSRVPATIEFLINKQINYILKSNSQREIAKMLFDFRNEMLYINNYR